MTRSEFLDWEPDTSTLREVFEEEVSAAGGSVTSQFAGGGRLFLRAILPELAGEVRRGDRFQGGVALRTRESEVLVHPYTFRLVCGNGAILAWAVDTRRVARVEAGSPSEEVLSVTEDVREAVRACCLPQAFQEGLAGMRSALEAEADQVLALLSMLLESGGMEGGIAEILFRQIEARFRRAEDRSRYGLMNAVTSVARDTSDPGRRWNLEELGGAIAAWNSPRVPEGSPFGRHTSIASRADSASPRLRIGSYLERWSESFGCAR